MSTISWGFNRLTDARAEQQVIFSDNGLLANRAQDVASSESSTMQIDTMQYFICGTNFITGFLTGFKMSTCMCELETVAYSFDWFGSSEPV